MTEKNTVGKANKPWIEEALWILPSSFIEVCAAESCLWCFLMLFIDVGIIDNGFEIRDPAED